MSSKKQEGQKVVITKKFGFKRFLVSFKYSWEGLVHDYKYEQSLWIHAGSSLLIILLGLILKVSFVQWAILLVSIVVVLAVELLNTAIEATIDLITDTYHPLAKVAKDSGSAAAFVASVVLFVICLFIFVPRIMQLF